MLKNYENGKGAARKAWPKDCVWPEPVYDGAGEEWDFETAGLVDLDEEGDDLLMIRDYYEGLVERGILNEDFSLAVDLDDLDDEWSDLMLTNEEGKTEFYPEIGEEYWFDGFDVEMWQEDLNDHMNCLKITQRKSDPVYDIREITGYSFINENLLRQAFTRRSFAAEYGLDGCSEELEFIGDSVLGAIVTREIASQLAHVDIQQTEAPFRANYNEGEYTRIRSQFVSKENLAQRAEATGLDKYILYGSGEVPGESSKEDMIEALIGAVAVDSGWDWSVLDEVVDRLLVLQLSLPGLLLRETFYDKFNAWHQKHFGCMPKYEVGKWAPYWCMITYYMPDGGEPRGFTEHKTEVRGQTRSKARELAAEIAYRYVVSQGKWINLRDAGMEPRLEDSINQLQELYQMKYVEEQPSYAFNELPGDQWYCQCYCDGITGRGKGANKTTAKKKAAYMVIVKLLDAAGICQDEWREELYEMME